MKRKRMKTTYKFAATNKLLSSLFSSFNTKNNIF